MAYFSRAAPWLLKMATLALSRSFLSIPSFLGIEPTKMAASKSLKAISSLSVGIISMGEKKMKFLLLLADYVYIRDRLLGQFPHLKMCFTTHKQIHGSPFMYHQKLRIIFLTHVWTYRCRDVLAWFYTMLKEFFLVNFYLTAIKSVVYMFNDPLCDCRSHNSATSWPSLYCNINMF